MRRDPTDAEKLLWLRLRNRQLAGYKFRRQVWLGPYIVDFACWERKLIVELDGGQHVAAASYDEARTQWLEHRGYRVVRFWNNEVLLEIDAVLEAVLDNLKG